MKISWLGHSSFLIEAGGTCIVTDPYDNSVGYSMPKVTADAVTCSHCHGDHSYVSNVIGNPVIINTPGEHKADNITICGHDSFHDAQGGKLRGGNIIYLFGCGNITVCHMGDIGEECSDALMNKLPPINVLLIPVGGYYTIDAKQAKRYVDLINPQFVIPMHYGTKGETP